MQHDPEAPEGDEELDAAVGGGGRPIAAGGTGGNGGNAGLLDGELDTSIM